MQKVKVAKYIVEESKGSLKIPFFQVYPDCLSQVIYVTFCEAFPESIESFDDHFKDGLVDLIFQWISGLKPRKCVWEKWNLESFKATTVNPNSEGATANIQARGSASSAAAYILGTTTAETELKHTLRNMGIAECSLMFILILQHLLRKCSKNVGHFMANLGPGRFSVKSFGAHSVQD
nr:protein FAM227B isoform X1 [Anser cygnoides]XP_047908304.1 protein FAM227B isoform X1 [Anser cygnoides]XP_047908305.1 protein FAM227B isoform X1 [Anser cygnoides]XP_047908306.1 protein FAM227B isoform X1 [Anser cygnoides]XP_047908309.1 protein FAM227B isoform X1 [Anser cygnoides]XP_047908310.1 protein FAM227B isoform X1 [Anser cygnoides]